MGFFDSILGLGTNKPTPANSRAMNGNIWQNTALNNQLISDAAQYAKGDVSQGTDAALGSLGLGYGAATSAVADYGKAARDALTTGVNQGVGTVEGSNAQFQPYAAAGQAATTMWGNALGLNGPGGNAAATAAFQASPGYQYQVDQATDAAARKAASLGMAGSGNTLDAVTRLGSNLADQQTAASSIASPACRARASRSRTRSPRTTAPQARCSMAAPARSRA